MNIPGPARCRLTRLSGACFALLSAMSVVLSLGAPGLGWALATVTMVVLGLCSRLVGRPWLYICLAVTAVHLFTFGPLGGGAGSSFGSDRFVGVAFAAVPFVAGMGALAATYLKPRKRS